MKRELGLYSVITISLGAMIGSGIFVLPGLAAKIAGPAAILAYLLAGVVVLPAALSKAEMATAMPESGGTYLYIDKSLGPLMGTVAGFGVWFSLIFKASFALVGLGAYLVYVAHLPERTVAVILAVALTLLNVAGVKQTAGVQKVVVTIVLGLLAFLVIRGSPVADGANLEPFFSGGFGGLLTATGVVFVSYAGVTKIASVAEEVKDPDRNLPRGMLGSLALMMVVYPAVVAVMVGTVGIDTLSESVVPVAELAATFLGTVGVDVVAAIAVLALISMANAGLLASSRYPFAMSRNALAPAVFQRLTIGSGTPVISILVTGAAMTLLVAFVPILELAKLASAFQLLLFALNNLALIAFRESQVDWYHPTFRSPFAPWLQIFGIGSSLVLLTVLGMLPLVGAVGITLGGIAWYQAFGRSRVSKQSAALDALRIRSTDELVETTRAALESSGVDRLVVVMRHDIAGAKEQRLLELGVQLLAPVGHMGVVHVDPAGHHEDHRSVDDQVGAAVDVDEVDLEEHRSRTRRAGLLATVEDHDPDLVLAEMPRSNRKNRPYITDARWLREHVERTILFFRYRGLSGINTIVIMGSGGPADVAKITIAHRLAHHSGAALRFVHLLGEEASDDECDSIRRYHHRIGEIVDVRTESVVERAPDIFSVLDRVTAGADLVILGAASRVSTRFSDLSERIALHLHSPVLTVRPGIPHAPSLWRRTRERLIY